MRKWAVLWCAAACGGEPTAKDTATTDTTVTDTTVTDTTDTVPTPTTMGCAAPLGRTKTGWSFSSAECWVVEIRPEFQQVVVRAPDGATTVELWGIGAEAGTFHENLKGKHIKDTLGRRRTLLVPGGVVVEAVSDPDVGGVGLVTLYEAGVGVALDVLADAVVWESEDAADAAAHEAANADGEAAELRWPGEGVLQYVNVYQQDEDVDGVPLEKVFEEVQLGETGGDADPTQVRDYYDDPRLDHT